MAKKLFVVTVAALLVFAMSASVVTAKVYRSEKQKELEQWRSEYGFPHAMRVERSDPAPTGNRMSSPTSLGTAIALMPGENIGFTFWDVMHNTTIRRNVALGFGPQVHFTWIFGSDEASNTRSQAYRAYDPRSGVFVPSGATPVNVGSALRGGYGSVDVVPYDDAGSSGWGNTPLLSAHLDFVSVGGNNYYSYVATTDPDFDPAVFDLYGMPPDTNWAYVDPNPAQTDTARLIWPMVEYHYFGTDTVTYVVCSESDDEHVADEDDDNLVIFRLVGPDPLSADWDDAYIITGAENGISSSLSASRTSRKVAVSWAEIRFDPVDIFLLESPNKGAPGSWVETNVTSYPAFAPGEDGPSESRTAWAASFCFISSNDATHVLWDQHVQASSETLFLANEIMHYYGPTGDVSLIYGAQWGILDDYVPDCVSSKSGVGYAFGYNVSECNTRLYAIWNMANPPESDNDDDCTDAAVGGATNAGNNDLWISVSGDLTGFGWDQARNLTETYTPECDTATPANQGDCADERSPSVARYGLDTTNATWGFDLDFGNADSIYDIDPSTPAQGAYAGSYFLDLIYIADQIPGESDEGPATRNDIRWFRVPCVEEVIKPIITFRPSEVGYPSYVNHGATDTIDLQFENRGNATLNITGIVVAEDSPGPTGWLGVNPTSLTVNFGPDRFGTVEVYINDNQVVDASGTVVALNGELQIASTDPTTPDTLFEVVDYLVADTIGEIVFDTVSTGCVGLIVSNNGNIGDQGGNSGDTSGGVNLDFWDCGECDTFADSLAGDGNVYLYGASPIALWKDNILGSDTILYAASIFGASLFSEVSFRPLLDEEPAGKADSSNFQMYSSGTAVTSDSTLGLEVYTYGPTDGIDVNYMIQVHKWFLYDGAATFDSLVLGNIMDWDLPSDTGVDNQSALRPAPSENFVYTQGKHYEYDSEEDCVFHDTRFATCALIGWTTKADPETFHGVGDFFNAFTGLNDDLQEGGSFVDHEGYLWPRMTDDGAPQLSAAETNDDLHHVITSHVDVDLSVEKEVWVYYVYATVPGGTGSPDAQQLVDAVAAGRAWYATNAARIVYPALGCCGEFDPLVETGNWTRDTENVKDLSDVLGIASYAFLGGAINDCSWEGNVSGDVDCVIDLSDVLALAQYAFLGGAHPAACNDSWPCPE